MRQPCSALVLKCPWHCASYSGHNFKRKRRKAAKFTSKSRNLRRESATNVKFNLRASRDVRCGLAWRLCWKLSSYKIWFSSLLEFHKHNLFPIFGSEPDTWSRYNLLPGQTWMFLGNFFTENPAKVCPKVTLCKKWTEISKFFSYVQTVRITIIICPRIMYACNGLLSP